ncbi:MAG: hypothetical protein U0529_01815 [Thermoanaerobaculia bacterium]
MRLRVHTGALLSVLLLASAAARAAVYLPIEDGELFRRADAVVVATSLGSRVVAAPGGLPETRTRFAVVDSLRGGLRGEVEVVVPGGTLDSGLSLVLSDVPRFATGARYVLALSVGGDGAFRVTELGLGAFEVVRDEQGHVFATRALFRGNETRPALAREADGRTVARPEPLRDLAGFAAWLRDARFADPAETTTDLWATRIPARLGLVRESGVSALWDDQWCPSGIPGTCGTAFTRYRWLDPSATVRTCDEDTSTYGQWGVFLGGNNEVVNAAALWTSDAQSNVSYASGTPMSGTCKPLEVPSAGTVAVYLDDVAQFNGTAVKCPVTAGGLVGLGGVVTDNSTHAWKGGVYTTIRAGMAWLRRFDKTTCPDGIYPSDLFTTVVAHTLGSTLGLTNADQTRNPNDTNAADDAAALMTSVYTSMPFPMLGSDDRAALCFLYGTCTGLATEAKVFVPVVLSAAGASGSQFVSEITFTNRSTKDATLVLDYTAAAGGGTGSVTDTLAAGRQVTYADAIAWLKSKGLAIADSGDRLGTLRVTFRDVYPQDAAVTVRTTSPVPAGVSPAVGRAGLAYAGVPDAKLLTAAAWIGGMRATGDDRSNVAVQHAGVTDDGPLTLRLTYYPGDGSAATATTDRTLTPGGWAQLSLTDLAPGATQGYVKVDRVSGRAPFYAYGVVNDNVNSDGSFVAPVTDATAAVQTALLLPVAVETSAYTTEVVLTNTTASAKTVSLAYYPSALFGAAATLSVPVGAGAQVIVPDFVKALRDAGAPGIGPKGTTTYQGAVFATVSGGTLAGLVTGGRTRNPAYDEAAAAKAGALATQKGYYGVFVPGVGSTGLALQGSWLAALQQTTELRSNLAILNTGASGESAATYKVEVFDGATGTKAGETQVTLGAREFTQLNGVLKSLAPSVTNAYARVSVASGFNPFVTYGVVNDGAEPGKRSGDGAVVMSEVVASQ